MCGIAGLYAFARGAVELPQDELQRISAWQQDRGPDDHGVWHSQDARCAFDHRRLAIIDVSSAGHQPMVAADHGLCITFNGEIYNYRELRAELEQSGHLFTSGSDTEVLLHLYAVHGSDMLRKLRGMYAFAIWDEKRRGLFLARDPLGIKPLYYSSSGGIFRFASLARALLAGGNVDRTPSAAAQAGFLLWGSVPEPLTWWSEIKALRAGHFLWVDEAGERKAQKFFDLAAILEAARSRSQEITLAEALTQSVGFHMVADVPVGIFLSSGLDSAALANLASVGASNRLLSVTASFEEFKGTDRDESAIASFVAKRLGMRHEVVKFSGSDFVQHRSAILAAMDQPTIDGINTYFVSLAAKRVGLKVVLSGLGGDELLGGYPSFAQVPALVRRLGGVPKSLGRLVRRGLAPFLIGISPKYAGLLEYGTTLADAYFLRRALFMPWELADVMGRDEARFALSELDKAACFDEAPKSSPYAGVAFFELSFYMRNQLLRDTDWSSMRHGVEVRVPFADSTLIQQMAPQIVSAKPPQKSSLAASIPSEIWREICRRPKRGFEVPIGSWVSNSGSPHRNARGWRGWALDVMAEFNLSR